MTPPNITPQELRALARWHYQNAEPSDDRDGYLGNDDPESRRRERLSALACERWADQLERHFPVLIITKQPRADYGDPIHD